MIQTKAKVLINHIISIISSAGLVMALLLNKANPAYYPPNRDSGLFLYAARVILNGGVLYRDIWDNKPPGIFYLNALGLWLGKDTSWGVWLIEFLFLTAATYISYVLLKKMWSTIPAIAGTLFWLFSISSLVSGGNIMEIYPLLFNFLALYWFYLHSKAAQNWIYPLLIGATTSLNFLIRPNIIGVQAAIVLVWCLESILNRRFVSLIKKICLFTAGLIIPFIVVFLYFSSLGTFITMIEASVLYNFSYTGGNANLAYSLGKATAFLGPTTWACLAMYLLIVVYSIKRLRKDENKAIPLLIILLWPIEIVLSILSGRAYEHYFVSWAPPFALIAGYAFYILIDKTNLERFKNKLNIYGYWVFPTVAVFMMVLNIQVFLEYRRAFLDIFVDQKRVYEINTPITDYIHDHTQADDSILVWGGQAGINYLAHRRLSTAYAWYPLYIDSPYTARMNETFLSDLVSHQPLLIIDAYQDAPEDILSINPEIRKEQLASGHSWLLLTNRTSNLQDVYQTIDTYYELKTNIAGYDVYGLKGSTKK